jgi:hypothetical protein
MPRNGTRTRSPQQTLPYRVELWDADGGERRVLARAASAQLARAIFRAATSEHPEMRITLSRGSQIIADSQSEQSTAE